MKDVLLRILGKGTIILFFLEKIKRCSPFHIETIYRTHVFKEFALQAYSVKILFGKIF